MKTNIILAILIILASSAIQAASLKRGIYISEPTLLTKSKLDRLIDEAKEAKIDTFVVDMEHPGKNYAAAIAKIKAANLRYVARVVMFPGGGNAAQIHSTDYWANKYKLVDAAVSYGVDEVQLDYIRYASKNRPSHQNALDVHKVIQWFKTNLAAKKIPLQIDVFGIALKSESLYIGQDVKLFADTVDVMCPMTYPSHFEPYLQHSKAPYQAVKELLGDLNRQFDSKLPFRLDPYIEVSNYRFAMSNSQKQEYIRAQIKAAKEAGAEGWYAWSPGNSYGNLFQALKKEDSALADASK
jgi:hypothetical protein